jgi:hypothetical protein
MSRCPHPSPFPAGEGDEGVCDAAFVVTRLSLFAPCGDLTRWAFEEQNQIGQYYSEAAEAVMRDAGRTEFDGLGLHLSLQPTPGILDRRAVVAPNPDRPRSFAPCVDLPAGPQVFLQLRRAICEHSRPL